MGQITFRAARFKCPDVVFVVASVPRADDGLGILGESADDYRLRDHFLFDLFNDRDVGTFLLHGIP